MDVIKGILVKTGGTYRGTNRLYVRVDEERYKNKLISRGVLPVVGDIYLFKVNHINKFTPNGLHYVGPTTISATIKLFMTSKKGASVDRYTTTNNTIVSFKANSNVMKGCTFKLHTSKVNNTTVLRELS